LMLRRIFCSSVNRTLYVPLGFFRNDPLPSRLRMMIPSFDKRRNNFCDDISHRASKFFWYNLPLATPLPNCIHRNAKNLSKLVRAYVARRNIIYLIFKEHSVSSTKFLTRFHYPTFTKFINLIFCYSRKIYTLCIFTISMIHLWIHLLSIQDCSENRRRRSNARRS
jgi:hypothetical protein